MKEEVKLKHLSVRQAEALEFIKSFKAENGYSPSVRELANGMNIKSSSTAQGYVERLEKHGYIVRDPNSPRTLRVIGEPPAIEVEIHHLRAENELLRTENETLRSRLEAAAI